MKIAFIGTHGVGKTTLCYDLAGVLKKQLASVDIVKEVARSCPLPINRETTLAAQSWILHTQIALEIVAENQHHAVICDRSVLDNYAYLVAAAGRHPVLDELIAYWMPTYDYLFKVPLGSTPEADGVRDVDLGFQREIDHVVDRLLVDSGLTYVPLPSGSRSRWISYVLKAMEVDPPPSSRKSGPRPPRQMPLPMDE